MKKFTERGQKAILPNHVLPAVLSLKEAKMLAMLDGKKIRHRYFMPDEYIYYDDKKKEWFTEEKAKVPYSYWLCMVPEMQTDWTEHSR